MTPTGEAVPNQLRVAVVASDPAMRSRLAEIIAQCGHALVEAAAAPDALLTDGTADGTAPASAVILGAIEGESAGRLPSDATIAQIDAALRAVAAGLTVRRPAARQVQTFGSLPEEPPVLLTPREVEVLTAIGNGSSNKAAARQLGISPHTVKFHIESLFRKLGASSRAEAVAKGLKRHIVEL